MAFDDLEDVVGRTLMVMLAGVALGGGMMLGGCGRDEKKMVTSTRPFRALPPTTQEMEDEQEKEVLATLVPVSRLENGVNFDAPDGEKWVRFQNDMMIHDLQRTNGVEAQWGQQVKVAYKLTAPGSDKVIDQAAVDHPLEFRVGSKGLIMGFNMGVLGMTEGSKRRVFVPPELGYGKNGDITKGVAAGQVLIFDLELLSVSGKALKMPPVVKPVEPLGPPLPGGGGGAGTQPGVVGA